VDPRPDVTEAVLEALAYADVFDWPLTSSEVHRWLTVAAHEDEVKTAISSARASGAVVSIDHLHVLPGRDHLVDERARRAAHAAQLWPEAVRYGRWLAMLPWVRLVAVTGSLAVDAPADDADIDLLVVTDDGRLWLTRALTIGVVRLAARLSPRAPSNGVLRLCPNYLLTTSSLDLPERDLYTAHELAQLVPLHGPETYADLLGRNRWYRDHLPNHPGYVSPIAGLGGGRVRRVIERWARRSAVDRLERWEMDRKVARLRAATPAGEARFDATTCKGHFGGHRQRTLVELSARLDRMPPRPGAAHTEPVEVTR